ncbi:MAG: hypothetical protein ABFS10_03850 [Bacteroidota bacterium]
MKKLILVSLAVVLSMTAFSQTSGFGIGAILGTTADFSMKLWTSETTAFDAAVGLDLGTYGGFHTNADFLFHLWSFDVAQDMMKIYFGPGIGMSVYSGYVNNVSIYPRAPGGVGYYFHSIPLEAFAEIAPAMDLIGPWDLHFRWSSYIGARWYF